VHFLWLGSVTMQRHPETRERPPKKNAGAGKCDDWEMWSENEAGKFVCVEGWKWLCVLWVLVPPQSADHLLQGLK